MSLLTSWLASTPPDVAVEIAPERVSAAVVTPRGSGLVVSAHAVQPLPPGVVTPSLTSTNIHDRALVAEALRRVLSRFGSRPRRVALVVPDTAAKVSLVRFDQVPSRRDDLDQLVRWQIRKSAPFALEDACVTYAAGAGGGASSEFVVEVARRDVIREYESVCEDNDAHAGLVDVATLSLLGLFSGRDASLADWLLVHVRPAYTSIAIVRGGHLIFYRNRQEDDDDGLPDLVHQTAMYYQDRLEGKGFERVLVAGSGRMPGSVDLARRSLEERLNVNVEFVDPLRAATLADRIGASQELVDALGPLVGLLARTRQAMVAA